jgi:hypothetical protein
VFLPGFGFSEQPEGHHVEELLKARGLWLAALEALRVRVPLATILALAANSFAAVPAAPAAASAATLFGGSFICI